MKQFMPYSMTILLAVIFITTGRCKNKEVILPAKQYSVEDFFRKPEKVAFALSPDGKYYAYKAPYNHRMNIFIQEIGKERVTQLTSDTTRDISTFIWGNNNRVLYLKDNGGDENFKLFGVDIDGSNLIGLTVFKKV